MPGHPGFPAPFSAAGAHRFRTLVPVVKRFLAALTNLA